MVSFSTLSAGTIEALEQQVHGVVILEYVHDPKDRVTSVDGYDTTAVKGEEKCAYRYYLVGWKGHSRTVNVMCGKVELEAMKHQLEALKVLR